jgi:hypothetical protein
MKTRPIYSRNGYVSMLRTAFFAICFLSCVACAEMPKVGDYVAVTQSIGIIEQMTRGEITEINASVGMINIKAESVSRRTGFMDWKTDTFEDGYNVTIAIQSITRLVAYNAPIAREI